MKVMKFGGSSLKNSNDFKSVAEIIKKEKDKKIIVLSGAHGVTDKIDSYLNIGKKDEKAIEILIKQLKDFHFRICSDAIKNKNISKKIKYDLLKKLEKLKRIFQGVYYTEELTDRTKDLILSYGERFSVKILEGILCDMNVKAKSFEADSIGVITDGDFGNATAILDLVSINLNKNVSPLLKKNFVPIITGFFGCDNNGNTTSFGRNGSDYSASVIAYAVDANEIEIWKDVNGFMSADPNVIKDAHLIDKLSYEEAAELAYFGAKILHPRTVEPLIKKGIELQIKNTYKPDLEGTRIGNHRYIKKNLVKSVAYSKDIACIKIHGSGVGYKPGVLSEIVSHFSKYKINIKSVITSQTCITLLLEKKDLQRSYDILSLENIKTVERLEKIKDIALIAIVGEGILSQYGIAAKVFNAVAEKGINIEMISAGASEVAYYFIVKEKDLKPAIKGIHKVFFS